MVDFQKGERLAQVKQLNQTSAYLESRQMNIDYAVCQSLHSMESNSRVIAIYDVACQWSRNFRRRVKTSKYLDIPNGITIIPAVGKWHLGAHVVGCFPKFSLNFIQGVGQVDGEILETLWSVTNKVAGITRAMGKSHRSEVLDDNMYDSNWKKWLGIGKCVVSSYEYVYIANKMTTVQALSRKYKMAKAALEPVQLAFQDLTSSVGKPLWIQEWKQLEAQASKKRGEAMMIYNVSPIQGTVYLFSGL